MLVPDFEIADYFILSYCGVKELGAIACVSKEWAKLIRSKDNDKRIWQEASKEFLEWTLGPTIQDHVIRYVYGGY